MNCICVYVNIRSNICAWCVREYRDIKGVPSESSIDDMLCIYLQQKYHNVTAGVGTEKNK